MNKNPIGSLIFGLLFAVVGYFVAFHFGKPILDNAKASAQWPSVEGIIERSEVTTSRSSGKNKKTMYTADIDYRYSVEDKEYRSSTIAFGGRVSSSSSSSAYAITKRYPVGQQVPVYYEPQKPENAVLEPGVTLMSYLVYGIGLLFLVIGGLMFAVSAGKLMLATVIVAGAATSVIGSGSRTDADDPAGRSSDPSSSGRHDGQTRPDDADDGFGIS